MKLELLILLIGTLLVWALGELTYEIEGSHLVNVIDVVKNLGNHGTD